MSTPGTLTRRMFLDQSLRIGAGSLIAGAVCSKAAWAADAAGPAGFQVGCFTRPWDEYDYLTALDAIAEAGFKYAGLMTAKSKTRLVISPETDLDEAKKIGQEAKKRGLQIPSVYGGGFPINPIQKGIDALRKLIDNCVAAGATSVMMGGVSQPDQFDPYYKIIAECCDYAAARNIGITVKPHGGSNSTGPQCRKVIDRVGKKNFRLWYDPGNIFFYSDGALDPVDDAQTVDGLVVGVSIKDFKPPKEVMVTPGTGKVNFLAVLSRLKKGGFTRGPLIIETLARGTPAELLANARQARTFVEDLVRQVDAA
jgi:sugar phosphate isomerase/epimerase